MDIELCVKFRFYATMNNLYKDNKFFRLIPALNNSDIVKKSKYNFEKQKGAKTEKRNKINDIIDSKSTDEEKFKELLEKIYLSDLLAVITRYEWLYKNKQFTHAFYCKKPKPGELDSNTAILCRLRNIIMHFDIKSYQNQKIKYIKTLAFWETQLHCRNHFIHDLPAVKPTINNILNLIKNNFPDIFKKNDREIVDIYDDIAFINGLPVEDLPQYWSIGRQIYQINRQNK